MLAPVRALADDSAGDPALVVGATRAANLLCSALRDAAEALANP